MCGDLFAYLGKKGKASPSRGGRSRTHVRRVGAGCPFRWTTPLRVLAIQLCIWPRNTKEPPPSGSGSSTNWTYVSPRYAVEGTSWGSVATQLKDWVFNIGPWCARATSEGLRGLLGAGAPGSYTRRSASWSEWYTTKVLYGTTFLFPSTFVDMHLDIVRLTYSSYREVPQNRDRSSSLRMAAAAAPRRRR